MLCRLPLLYATPPLALVLCTIDSSSRVYSRLPSIHMEINVLSEIYWFREVLNCTFSSHRLKVDYQKKDRSIEHCLLCNNDDIQYNHLI